MTADDFARAVGGSLCHVTARQNLSRIETHGLQTADIIARAAGHAPADILLRHERRVIQTPEGAIRLNHQRPILHGLTAANSIIDGHDARSWAAQLDQRVFFWPARRGDAFRASIARELDMALIWLDACAVFDALAPRIDLCPINSGNFRQGGARARRGDWIYMPVGDGFDKFRFNRVRRGLTASPDSVAEVSIRGAISPDVLRILRRDLS